MAAAGRRRQAILRGVAPKDRPPRVAAVPARVPPDEPAGIAEPTHADREVVDLLFFPTGGGKTEAYLGLAAFTLVLRRLRNPGIASAGVSVLMRYTLRLLTLDQLGRASTLDLRAGAGARSRTRRSSATGRSRSACGSGRPPRRTAWATRATTTPTRRGPRPSPSRTTTASPRRSRWRTAPGAARSSARTPSTSMPNPDQPTDLRIICMNRDCDFTRGQPLPILGRRRADLPPPALLPDRHGGQVRGDALDRRGRRLLRPGRTRYDSDGFYGPCEPGSGRPARPRALLPPDLVIQDELHLISGPLGTMVGLYETALDELCVAGDQRQDGPAEDRRLDGHGPPGRATRSGRSSIAAPSTSSRRPGPTAAIRSLPRPIRPDESNATPLPRRRRPGPQPQGRHAAHLPGAAGRGPEGLLRPRRKSEQGQPGRSVHDAARLFQQPARAGRQPPHHRGRGRQPGLRATAAASGSARRTASSPTARSPTTWSS